jgi:hypothetical protein
MRPSFRLKQSRMLHQPSKRKVGSLADGVLGRNSAAHEVAAESTTMSTERSMAKVIRFGVFEFDPSAGELRKQLTSADVRLSVGETFKN